MTLLILSLYKESRRLARHNVAATFIAGRQVPNAYHHTVQSTTAQAKKNPASKGLAGFLDEVSDFDA